MKKKYLAAGAASVIGGVIAWKFLNRAGEASWDDALQTLPHSDHSQFVEIDGLRVHYQEFGAINKPTLVLIHGYTASVYVWHAVAPILAKNDFHVVAVDLVGFGYSSKPAWFDYSIAAQARVISRLMNRLGIGRASLIGSSYGGAVAATIALDYPERVEKLVLVDAVCNDEATNHPLLKLVKIRGIGEFFTPFLADSKRFARRRLRNTWAPENHHLITDDRITSGMHPLKARDAHRSVLATARNWDACRIEEDAQYINQPTLVVWGEQDTVIPIRHGYALYDSILNSRFVVFRGCGHVPPEEKPKLFARVVTEFCRAEKSKFKLKENDQMRVAS